MPISNKNRLLLLLTTHCSLEYVSRFFISSLGGDTHFSSDSITITRIFPLAVDVRRDRLIVRCTFYISLFWVYRLYTLQTACLWLSLAISLTSIRRSGLVYKPHYLVLIIDPNPIFKRWHTGPQLPNHRQLLVIIAFYPPMLVYMYRLSNWELWVLVINGHLGGWGRDSEVWIRNPASNSLTPISIMEETSLILRIVSK